jgi:hypothetical protein
MQKINAHTYQIQKDNGAVLFTSSTPCGLILLYAGGKGLFTPQYVPKHLFNVKLVKY